MGENNWKIAAIVLAALLLLETAGVAWLFMVGMDEISNEDKCMQVCTLEKATSYQYEYGVCSCYEDGELVSLPEV